MYIINNEICSRLVCKEHEVMKGKMISGFLVGGAMMREVNRGVILMDPRSGFGGGL